MKTYILIILIFLNFSCNRSKQEKETSSDIKAKVLKETNSYIEDKEERISLLAISKGISGDTLKLMLIDYYTEKNILDEIKIKDNERIINSISKKYHYSKIKVASLIYNFEYELLTRDEIFEIEQEKYMDEAEEEAAAESQYN